MQPPVAAHMSVVHGLLSLHTTLDVPAQTPAVQVSLVVHALLSLQGVLSAAGVRPHLPVAGAQVLSWHSTPLDPHVTTVAASTTHLFDAQISVPLHRLPSSNLAQSALIEHAQLPVPGLHEPLLHLSPVVHALPSSHARAFAANTQPSVLSQESVVHGLPSSQVMVPVPVQTPAAHVSPVVQGLASSQPTPVAVPGK